MSMFNKHGATQRERYTNCQNIKHRRTCKYECANNNARMLDPAWSLSTSIKRAIVHIRQHSACAVRRQISVCAHRFSVISL